MPGDGARISRRRLFELAASGAVVAVVAGCEFGAATEEETRRAANELRPDGRPRLPPNQYLLKALRPMGGSPGDPSASGFRLKVSGEVRKPMELSFSELLELPQVEQTCDVHCVTKWSCLDVRFKGVAVAHLADLAGVKDSARHVIFEAAHGYTANVPIKEATAPGVLIAHRMFDEPLAQQHGPPARALVPDLYFWKSAKWITGIRFAPADEPGYWETRGYHNHADPWKEERYG
jgi:DMSO/TMAO reductase YedYZ molybdopterin-dependent catalytic subunit